MEVCTVNASAFSRPDDPVECQYRGNSAESLSVKFWTVLVFGSTLCLIAIPENLYLLYLFLSRRSFRNSPLFYMAILGMTQNDVQLWKTLFDLLLSPAYILANSVSVWFDCRMNFTLFEWYMWYIRPLLLAARTILVASNFLILVATLERFLKTRNNRFFVAWASWVEHHRGLLSCFTVVIGFCLDGVSFFAIEIQHNPNCSDWTKQKLSGRPLLDNMEFHQIYMFYFNSIMKTFLPFFLLLCMNFAIINTVKKERRSELMSIVTNKIKINETAMRQSIRKQTMDGLTSARKLRDATRLLLFVVLMYLISNCLNIILAVWEFYDSINRYPYNLVPTLPMEFQDFGTDASNILVVLSRNLRLPVYLLCNAAIRNESKVIFTKLGFCGGEKRAADRQTVTQVNEILLTDNRDASNGIKGSFVDYVIF